MCEILPFFFFFFVPPLVRRGFQGDFQALKNWKKFGAIFFNTVTEVCAKKNGFLSYHILLTPNFNYHSLAPDPAQSHTKATQASSFQTEIKQREGGIN